MGVAIGVVALAAMLAAIACILRLTRTSHIRPETLPIRSERVISIFHGKLTTSATVR